ncbi:hypothetical protein PSHT_02743, partial [Puccinia striiformis]
NLLAPGKDRNDQNRQDGEISYNQVISGQGLTLLAVLAVKDPLRPGVTEVVASRAQAGVAVKIVTVDSIITVMQCGIYTSRGIIMGASVHTDILHLHRFNIMCYSGNLQAFVPRVPEDKTTSSWLHKNNFKFPKPPHLDRLKTKRKGFDENEKGQLPAPNLEHSADIGCDLAGISQFLCRIYLYQTVLEN